MGVYAKSSWYTPPASSVGGVAGTPAAVAPTTGYGTAQRPPATTWQQQQEYDAQDLFGEEGQRTLNDETTADQNAAKYRSAADAATAGYGAAAAPTNTEAWSPTATAGYQPSQVAQWQASLGNLKAAVVPLAAGSVGGAGSESDPGGYSKALTSFNADALMNFDPSAAGATYAQGAEGAFESQLKGDLTSLTNKAVGSGRLNTGFFDTDQGNVIKSNAANFNNALATAALGFSSQKEAALASGTADLLSRAQGIDANTLTGQGQANQLYETNEANAIKTAEDENTFALGKYSTGLQGAEFQDSETFAKDQALDAGTYARANFLDTTNRTNATTGLDAALSREQEYNNLDTTAQAAGQSYASAARQWAAQDRAAQDARDATTAANAKKKLTGGGFGGPVTDPANAVDARIASDFGVPFRG